jgi:hypothetical protein
MSSADPDHHTQQALASPQPEQHHSGSNPSHATTGVVKHNLDMELLNPVLMQSMTSVRQGGRSVGKSPSSNNMMNLTFSSNTNIPPQSGAYIAMMQAKMERE